MENPMGTQCYLKSPVIFRMLHEAIGSDHLWRVEF